MPALPSRLALQGSDRRANGGGQDGAAPEAPQLHFGGAPAILERLPGPGCAPLALESAGR